MPDISRHAIRTWIQTIATGEFHYRNILGLSGKLSPEEDMKLRKVIWELCHEKEPIVESVGRNDGYYRPIDSDRLPIDFAELRPRNFPVVLPFDLRKYVFIYPDTTIVISGSKSSGKTGFLYRTIALNRDNLDVILLSNMEGGRELMYDRFKAMGIDLAVLPKFVYNVSEHFHDHIKKENTLYVVDYIDAPDGTDFFLIGAQIQKIDRKLQGLNSVAVIGLQKPSSRDIAFGGEQTLKAPSLYVALDSNKLKIVDAKVPADKKVHPKNMMWSFLYDEEGTSFKNIEPYYGGE